jgi:prepilin-type N-terminal cleavage/methylation domain-containing protein
MTSTTGHSNKRPRGFTLLELIVVMLILCISLATVAPTLRGFWDGGQLRNSALQILALTRWARTQAVTSTRVHALRFDPGERTYRLEAAEGLTFLPIPSDFGRLFTAPEEYEIEVTVVPGAERNCIRFYPDGRSDGIRIRIIAPENGEIRLEARSPTEQFVLIGDELELGVR